MCWLSSVALRDWKIMVVGKTNKNSFYSRSSSHCFVCLVTCYKPMNLGKNTSLLIMQEGWWKQWGALFFSLRVSNFETVGILRVYNLKHWFYVFFQFLKPCLCQVYAASFSEGWAALNQEAKQATGLDCRAQAIGLYFLLQYCSCTHLLSGYVFYRSGLPNEDSLFRMVTKVNRVINQTLWFLLECWWSQREGLGFQNKSELMPRAERAVNIMKTQV